MGGGGGGLASPAPRPLPPPPPPPHQKMFSGGNLHLIEEGTDVKSILRTNFFWPLSPPPPPGGGGGGRASATLPGNGLLRPWSSGWAAGPTGVRRHSTAHCHAPRCSRAGRGALFAPPPHPTAGQPSHPFTKGKRPPSEGAQGRPHRSTSSFRLHGTPTPPGRRGGLGPELNCTPPPPPKQSNRTSHPGAPLTQPKHVRAHRGLE